jgi:hypothetical protein
VSNWRLSEADDKAESSRRLRQKAKTALRLPFVDEPDLPEKPRGVSDRWGFKKDG